MVSLMMSVPDKPTSLADLLAFYAEAGVDEPILEEAVDRFTASTPVREAAPRTASAPLQAAPAPSRAPAMPVVPDEGQAALARQMASSAQSLDELREAMASFEGCNLRLTAKNLVFARGNPDAGLMLVGEAPGRDEDIEGLPFVGRSGQLLDLMLAAIGREGDGAYIANVVPWRPPGNRTPTPIETEICRPFIERQIELANPKVLVTMGELSSQNMLHTHESITRLRGNWRVFVTPSGKEIPATATFHPAYLLRTPAHKKLAWRDFLEVRAKLEA